MFNPQSAPWYHFLAIYTVYVQISSINNIYDRNITLPNDPEKSAMSKSELETHTYLSSENWKLNSSSEHPPGLFSVVMHLLIFGQKQYNDWKFNGWTGVVQFQHYHITYQ